MSRHKEDKIMKELWRIKREASKEISGMPFEKLKRHLEESKKSCLERALKFSEKDLTKA